MSNPEKKRKGGAKKVRVKKKKLFMNTIKMCGDIHKVFSKSMV